jgi:hypothetical protein
VEGFEGLGRCQKNTTELVSSDMKQIEWREVGQDMKLDPWLLELVRKQSSGSLVERAAAIGTIGRLAESHAAAAASVKYVSQIRAEVLGTVEDLACSWAIGVLGDVFDRAWSLDLIHRRDALESVFFVLVQRRLGDRLGVLLEQIDEQVCLLWEVFPPTSEDPICRRVAVCEPEAWWGWLGCDDLACQICWS